MTLRLWLVFFIFSMLFSAEVLLWAVNHGQFSNVNRGRWLPLRSRAQVSSLPPPRRRPWELAAMFFGLFVLAWYWADAMVSLVRSSF